MPNTANTERFICSTFRSIWDLELLVELRQHPETARSTQELVTTLRASESVVAKGIHALLAAGLINEEGDGSVRYGPASAELEKDIASAVEMYRAKPDAVRRLIVASATRGLTAFSDAFRIKGD